MPALVVLGARNLGGAILQHHLAAGLHVVATPMSGFARSESENPTAFSMAPILALVILCGPVRMP